MDPRDLGVALLSRLPLPLADALAWIVAWVWWWLVPIRRRVAVDNLRAALPACPPRATLVRSMHEMALGYLELVRWGRGDVVVEVNDRGVPPGVIILSGHGAAWDLVLLACADRRPVAAFLRPPANPWVRAQMEQRRREHDVDILDARASLAEAEQRLDTGRSVILIQDQHHGRGIPSRFFGRMARTSTGFARLVRRSGRPAYGAWPTRVGRGRLRLDFEPLALPPPVENIEADTEALTDAANAWYESHIRACPHAWLWLHRRWK